MHKEKPRAEVLIRWRGVVDGSALIESHFPVSRTLSSSNYILSSPPVLATFALFFLFWLGPASDHSAHTLTTISFQYLLSVYLFSLDPFSVFLLSVYHLSVYFFSIYFPLVFTFALCLHMLLPCFVHFTYTFPLSVYTFPLFPYCSCLSPILTYYSTLLDYHYLLQGGEQSLISRENNTQPSAKGKIVSCGKM